MNSILQFYYLPVDMAGELVKRYLMSFPIKVVASGNELLGVRMQAKTGRLPVASIIDL